MQKADLLFTYDDYLTLPNDGKRYEIIEGELFMTPAPSTEHQEVLLNLVEVLRAYVRAHSLGKVFCSPLDVVLSMTDVVQPDIVFVSKARLSIIAKKNIVAAPDLVIEVVSENTEKTDRTTKKALYERHGVKEYWVVDPMNKSIEVYLFHEGAYSPAAIFSSDDSVTSPQLPGLSLPVRSVFES